MDIQNRSLEDIDMRDNIKRITYCLEVSIAQVGFEQQAAVSLSVFFFHLKPMLL